jgi:hypothetical protein
MRVFLFILLLLRSQAVLRRYAMLPLKHEKDVLFIQGKTAKLSCRRRHSVEKSVIADLVSSGRPGLAGLGQIIVEIYGYLCYTVWEICTGTRHVLPASLKCVTHSDAYGFACIRIAIPAAFLSVRSWGICGRRSDSTKILIRGANNIIAEKQRNT